MTDVAFPVQLRVEVGTLSSSQLRAALATAGARLNEAADRLLENPAFARRDPRTVPVVRSTVRQLGFADGASLSDVLARAQELGLHPCPPITGPYLRLAMPDQAQAPDSVMSKGTAPSGSLTVGSLPLSPDHEYPKGFYLRVVDGVPWLRGYYTDDNHRWDPGDAFAFSAPDDRSAGG